MSLQDRVYLAGEFYMTMDPEYDASAVSDKIVHGALSELVKILEEEKPLDVTKFIRNLL